MSPAIECYFFKSSFRYPILIDTITVNIDANLGGFVTFYERFMKFNYFALLAVATAALTACGGGGSSETAQQPVVTADAVDKYMGTWVACVAGTATTSTKETLVYTKASATSANVTFTQTSHAGTTCAGNSTNGVYTATSVATLAGTKTIGTSTADKINIKAVSPAGPDEKDISIIEGNTLKLGDETMLDTDGYPRAFENVYVYTKQLATGSTPAEAADFSAKYVGTRVSGCETSTTGANFSFIRTVKITKTAANVISYSQTTLQYSGVNCAGTGTKILDINGMPYPAKVATFAINGQKTLTTGELVEKFVATSVTTLATVKEIAYLTATSLTLGNVDTGASLDADGYPNTLDARSLLTKQ
jgi:hypothetical protein